MIDVKVYDSARTTTATAAAPATASETGFLIDLEKYTMQRFGSDDGIVEWVCLDCSN